MRHPGKLFPLILLCAFLYIPTEASANSVLFTLGPRVGTFNSTSNTSLLGLSFTPSVGGGFASAGVGVPNGLSLGYFVLSNTPGVYNGTFNLKFDFISPQGSTPSIASFDAIVTGEVGSNNTGSVTIDFLNNTQTFTFDNPGGTGVFTLTLPDKVITNFGQEIFLPVEMNVISVTLAPVPEPATMLLLGTGLAGIVGAARRRRKR